MNKKNGSRPYGESLGEHGEKSHAYFIYQSTVRVPLIIKVPGGAQGKTIDSPVSIVDVVPTVLGLLGIESPPQVQGENLAGYFFDEGEQAKGRSVYCESLYPTKFGCSALFGLIQGTWKYVWTKRPELYDLENDPAEMKNLIESEPDIAGEMQARLRKVLAERSRTKAADSRLSRSIWYNECASLL